MPGLVRKFTICAAADGLVLHPTGARDRNSKSISIAYGTNEITSAQRNADGESEARSCEASGIVGLLDLVSSSHLIVISRREQVAQIRGRAIYAVRDVTLIPLSSQPEAEHTITAVQKTSKQGGVAPAEDVDEDSGAESDNEISSIGGDGEQPLEAAALEPPKGKLKKSTTYVKDVMQDKGKYGRFAERWFSKGGWNASGRRRAGMSDEEDLTKEQERQAADALPEHEKDAASGAGEASAEQQQDSKKEDGSKAEAEPPKQKSVLESLTPRILRSAKLYFSSSGFFFSYEHDISGTLMQRDNITSTVPLWKRFGEDYFWNRNLQRAFIEAGQDAYVLPLLQGFVGQRAFSIARTAGTEQDVVAEAAHKAEDVVAAQEKPEATGQKDEQDSFLLTLVSRRSIKRAGLRYLRRGIDDDGYVANSVETEQMLSPQSWDMSAKTFSLLQIRGSIPLFFSQSPYSFKPIPTMFGSEATNQAAFKQHIHRTIRRYGAVQCASLVDKHATEKPIGEAYEKHAKLLNDSGGLNGKGVGFEWFDFHSACKGMKYENVSLLMDILESPLKSFGWIVKQNDRNIQQQTGVLRTNCMDCLDRTNVVQSAVAGWALQQQLAELGLNIDLKNDPKTQWFNTLWADNGDAISKQYAGTAALKGDFTRTRKRNWTGALSDFSLTLNRYYNNIFGDYFLQLNIDFFLGNVGPQAFEDFEADMMGQDYALDVGKIRQNAIDMCVKIVLEDPKDDLVGGWTLSCPKGANTVRGLPFEECVLLITDMAVYFCRFDWDAEKVGSFERVDLLDVSEVWRGAYITSTLGPTHTDEVKNVGFALRYKTRGEAVVRTNTRSMQNEEAVPDEASDKADDKTSNEKDDKAGSNSSEKKGDAKQAESKKKEESRLLAFKAVLPTSSAARKEGSEETATMSEQELIKHICNELHRLMIAAARKQRGFDHLELDKVPQVQERDVVSVADARKSTGYIESLGYSLKKLVWS